MSKQMSKQWIGVLGALGMVAAQASAATLYSQNFEAPVTVGSGGPVALGGYTQPSGNVQGSGYQFQGGGGGSGPTTTYGVDTNGVGGSQALFVSSNNTTAADFTYQQLTTYGSVAAPGAGTLPSQVQVSVAVFVSGSEGSTTPVGLNVQNGTTDFVFTPVLTNNAFTTVTFTLNQTTASPQQQGGVAGAFDPTLGSNFRVQYGVGGFGFDAGNVVRIDNVVIQTVVPEPAGLAALGVGAAAAVRRRRR